LIRGVTAIVSGPGQSYRISRQAITCNLELLGDQCREGTVWAVNAILVTKMRMHCVPSGRRRLWNCRGDSSVIWVHLMIEKPLLATSGKPFWQEFEQRTIDFDAA